ncbi:MAG: hypothetical protein ABIW33_08915 [Sphingomicrobium sp.]
MIRGSATKEFAASQPIAQSTALLILVMVVGIAGFMWYSGYMRSRAALVALAMVIGLLAYLSFWTSPITSP